MRTRVLLAACAVFAASCGGTSADYARTQGATSSSYTCGGSGVDVQDPDGTYVISQVVMPDGIWTNASLTISDAAYALTWWDMRNGPNEIIHCIARWNGNSFKAQCPKQQGILPHEVEFEGVQTNNGTSASLTASGFTWLSGNLHTYYTQLSATSTFIRNNRQFPGNPIPCPNATPVSVTTKNYNWQIGPNWYTGTITAISQNHSFYEFQFTNPSAALFPSWDGFAFAVLDTSGIMNFYVQTGQGAGAGPWGQGSATDPIWAWKQWVSPYYYYQYNVGPYAYAPGSSIDFY